VLKIPNIGHCPYTLRYATKSQGLHEFVYKNIIAVIPGDLDYALPEKKSPKAKNTHSLSYKY
jgi:hypothetical protein